MDVGRGQLHHRLRTDPRVANHERLHAARLPGAELPHPDYDWVVMDLSFISLRKILPAVWPRLRPGGLLICLVKPQFEATRAEADAGRGIIRDPAVRERILKEIVDFATSQTPGVRFPADRGIHPRRDRREPGVSSGLRAISPG